jgi:hypothetical protein
MLSIQIYCTVGPWKSSKAVKNQYSECLNGNNLLGPANQQYYLQIFKSHKNSNIPAWSFHQRRMFYSWKICFFILAKVKRKQFRGVCPRK